MPPTEQVFSPLHLAPPQLHPLTPFPSGVLQLDPWLEDHREVLKQRYSLVEKWASGIASNEGGLDKFSKVRCC